MNKDHLCGQEESIELYSQSSPFVLRWKCTATRENKEYHIIADGERKWCKSGNSGAETLGDWVEEIHLTWAIELSHTTGWGMCQALNKLMGSEIVTQGTISPSKGSLQRISALMKTEESRAERSVSQKNTEERRDGWWGGRGDKRNRTSQKVLSLLSFWLGEISSWMIGKQLLYPQLQK